MLAGDTFTVAERPAFVFLPPEEKRTRPQPWIFYAPTLPPYPDEAERWMHEQAGPNEQITGNQHVVAPKHQRCQRVNGWQQLCSLRLGLADAVERLGLAA